MLKKGDPCYVRYKGKIQTVKYLKRATFYSTSHFVSHKEDGHLFATRNPDGPYECRFVCMTGIKGKDNEKQS